MPQLYSRSLAKKRAREMRDFKAQGWANKEIAHLFDVSLAQVSRVLRNQRHPDPDYDKCKVCKWNKMDNKKLEI